ncbi:hypothetical protein T261_5743 [Streptomyces lydicus]|nr:hypothetical protein T261_5743 [Streptomyces lydicus]
MVAVGVGNIYFLHRDMENCRKRFSQDIWPTAVNEEEIIRHGV